MSDIKSVLNESNLILDECLNSNASATGSKKQAFKNYFDYIMVMYLACGVTYEFDEGIQNLIKNVSLKECDDPQKMQYNKDANELSMYNSPDLTMNFNMLKAMLELSSTRYDEKNNRYNSGLIRHDSYGNEQLVDFNQYFISWLIKNFAGLDDPSQQSLNDIVDRLEFTTLKEDYDNGKLSEEEKRAVDITSHIADVYSYFSSLSISKINNMIYKFSKAEGDTLYISKEQESTPPTM